MVEETQTSKILIIDDEEKNVKLITILLKHHGYAYETASNGLEAIEKTKTYMPDLVLLDLIMPEMDGYEVCKRLKEDPLTQHIPVVMVTNFADRDPRIKGFEAGAADFLTKPIDRAELLLRVRNLLKFKHAEDFLLRNTQMLETEVRKKTYDLQDKLDQIERVNTELNLKSKLLDLANDSIFLHDLEGNFLYVNEAACRSRGYSRDELMKINLRDMDTPEYTELIKPRINILMETGETVFESAHFCKDKAIMPVEVRARIIELDGKKLILSVAREITERKRAEEALHEIEERYRAIANNTILGITIMDTDYKIIMTNTTFAELFGKSPSEFVGKYCFGEYKHREAVCPHCPGTRAMASGNTAEVETYTVLDDGSRVDVRNRAIPLFSRDGAVKGFIEVVENITEKKKAQEALDESEKKYRNLVDNALVGIYRTNLKGDMLYVNDALARMFEFESTEEMMSESVPARYKNPKDRDVFMENLKKTGRVESFEVEMTTKKGETKNIVLNANLEGEIISGMIMDITERKQSEDQIKRQLERLKSLRDIDKAITSSMDLNLTLKIILEEVTKQLKIDAADILLLNPHMQTLEYVAGTGFYTSALKYTKLMIGKGFAGQASYERRTISIPNLSEVPGDLTRAPLMKKERFISYFAAPLITKGQVKGVLELFHRSPFVPEHDWLDFLDALAVQAAIAIDNASLFDNLQRSNVDLILSYDETLKGWSKAMDMRDKETEGHTQRVTDMTLRLARVMGIKEEDLVHIQRGALLHDMGKMGVPDNVLLKPGTLTDEEWELMRKHPVYAYELLSPIDFLRPALDIPYCHHEKWDGMGYPRGLKGEQIPLSARIFAVVDVWDALCSDRPYRPAWSEEKATEYILEQSGRHFDPKVVEDFLKFLSEQQL